YWDDPIECPWDGGVVYVEPTSVCDDPDPTVAAQCDWQDEILPFAPITNEAVRKKTFQFQVDATFAIKAVGNTAAAGVRVGRDATAEYRIFCPNVDPYDYILPDRVNYGQPLPAGCTWKAGFSVSFAVLEITKFDLGAEFLATGAQLSVAT